MTPAVEALTMIVAVRNRHDAAGASAGPWKLPQHPAVVGRHADHRLLRDRDHLSNALQRDDGRRHEEGVAACRPCDLARLDVERGERTVVAGMRDREATLADRGGCRAEEGQFARSARAPQQLARFCASKAATMPLMPRVMILPS